MFRIRLRQTKKETSPEFLTTRSLWLIRRVIEKTINTSLRGWSGSHNNKEDNNINNQKLKEEERTT
jgi:hypothetical protein